MSGTHEPQPQRFPRSAQDLRSTNLCPYCFTLISAGQHRCEDCGLNLAEPTLRAVHSRSLQIADLLDQRSQMLNNVMTASLVAEQPATDRTDEVTAAPALPAPSAFADPTSTSTGFVAPAPQAQAVSEAAHNQASAPTSTVPATVTAPAADTATPAAAAPSLPAVPAQTTPARRPRPSLSAPMLILAVGITFLAIAAAVFLTVAFVTFSLTTKALITAAITLSTMGIASVLRWRKLTATAEGVAVLGGILLTLDAWAIQALNFFGLGAAPQSLYWGVALSIISLLCVAWGWISHLRAPRIMAALACIPGATGLIMGVFGDTAQLPALIPLGAAGVIVGTGLLSRTPARPLEAGLVIAASHISALSVTITPWFSVPEPWAWTVIGQLAIVAALIGQMFLFGRDNKWDALSSLRYSAAILAAGAWMLALTYTAHRIEPTLDWAPAALAALAGLGLVIADAAIRPRARAVGLTATITLGILWLPFLLGTTVWQVMEVIIARAFTADSSTRGIESPELLAFGLSTLVTAGCAAGLYALLGRGRKIVAAADRSVSAEKDEADALLRSRVRLLAAAGVVGIVVATWALPALLATVLLVVWAFLGAVLGGWGLARKGGVNLAPHSDLIMWLSALATFFTQEWGSGAAALVSGILLVAGVTRTVLTNAGAGGAANAGAEAPATPVGHVVSEAAIRALAGTSLALIAAVSAHFHLLISQQDWPGYLLTAGLCAAAILVCVPLVWTGRLLNIDAELLAVGGTVLAVLDTAPLLVSTRTGLWLEPSMIAATALLGLVVAGVGAARLATVGDKAQPDTPSEVPAVSHTTATPRTWPRMLGAPLPVFVTATVAALSQLIGRAGVSGDATPWMVLAEAPTVLGASALITALMLVVLRARIALRAPQETTKESSDDPRRVNAAQHFFAPLTAPAVITAIIAGVNLVGITQQLATGTTMLADGAGLLATALALVALGAILGRTVPAGPPISWVGAAVIGIYGPALLNATLVDPWPLLVMAPLTVALAASALGFATRPASHTRGGAWAFAALVTGAYATLILSLIATAIRENLMWMNVAALAVALAVRLAATMIRLPERFQPATWLLSAAAGVGAALALAQIVADGAMASIPASALVACVSAMLLALPARMQGRMRPAPAAHMTRPLAAPIAPSLQGALALLMCADIIVLLALMLALTGESSGLHFAALLGGLAAGAGVSGSARIALTGSIGARTPVTTEDNALLNRVLFATGVAPVVSTALVALSAALAFSSGLRAFLETTTSELPAQIATLSSPLRLHHSVLMAVAAGALAVGLVYLARNSGIMGHNNLVTATAASLPATVWAAVMALPSVGEWAWWPLLSAGVGAIVMAGVAVLARSRVNGVMLWSAAATVPLPLIALLVPQAERIHVGVSMMLVAAALCVLLFAAPPAHERESGEVFTALRGMSVLLALLGGIVLDEVADPHWLPALSLPAGMLSILTAVGLHLDRARNAKAVGEAPVYAALAPLLAVASLVWTGGTVSDTTTWWSLGFVIAMGGLTVLLALAMRLNARTGAGQQGLQPDPMDAQSATLAPATVLAPATSPAWPNAERSLSAALVGHSIASLFSLWIYVAERSVYDMPPLTWADYAVGAGLAGGLLIATALVIWSMPSLRSIAQQLPVIATGGGVSVATAIIATMMANTGYFPAEGATLAGAILALSILGAIPVVLSGLAPVREDLLPQAAPIAAEVPTNRMPRTPVAIAFARAMIVGLIATACALHRALGATITGHDTAIEIFILPVGLALLIVGILATERGVGKTSWTTCAPGLALLVVIPLIAEVMERSAWRIGILTVIIVAVIVVGALRRLQAPLLTGSAAALIHAVIAIRTALPELVVPWWVWLSIAGIILVVVASTYEARLRDARRLGEAVRALR